MFLIVFYYNYSNKSFILKVIPHPPSSQKIEATGIKNFVAEMIHTKIMWVPVNNLFNGYIFVLIIHLQIFWFFRGTLKPMMLWYVFVQCLFLLFQFITTDFFAWYEPVTANPTSAPPTWSPITNCSVHPTFPECGNSSNGSNGTNGSYFGPVYEEKWLNF